MTSGQPPELAALRTRLAEVDHLGSAASVLAWDQYVTMPPAGAAGRADALGALERVIHGKLVDPEVGRWLDALEPYARDLDPASDEARYLSCARRDHEKAARIPEDLAVAMAREAALGERSWVAAREADDFAPLRDALERQFDLRRRYAACFPEAVHPYDVLLDDFEEGATVAQIRPLLDELQHGLRPLISAGRPPHASVLHGEFDVRDQEGLVRAALLGLGFTDDRFRLDESAHPFSSSPAYGDHRITTRYRSDEIAWSLYSALHEFGHALYEAQVDPALIPGPLGHTASLGIHESQSRLWENQVGRSRPFCVWLLGLLRRHLDGFDGVTVDELFGSLNGVAPSLIRTEADETTYNLHIVLRVGLEVSVLEGTLEVAALPAAWDEGMERLLGVVPERPSDSILQDIHWATGLIGYFGTYALGNLVAAALWERVQADVPGVEAGLEAGEFGPLREWLGEHVHRHGRRHPPLELVRRATGTELSVEPLLRHLSRRLADAGALPVRS